MADVEQLLAPHVESCAAAATVETERHENAIVTLTEQLLDGKDVIDAIITEKTNHRGNTLANVLRHIDAMVDELDACTPSELFAYATTIAQQHHP